MINGVTDELGGGFQIELFEQTSAVGADGFDAEFHPRGSLRDGQALCEVRQYLEFAGRQEGG